MFPRKIRLSCSQLTAHSSQLIAHSSELQRSSSVRLASDLVSSTAYKKIEVRALIGLLDVIDVQPAVSARRNDRLRRTPRRTPSAQLRVVNIEVQTPRVDVQLDRVAIADECERAACSGF